MAMDQALPDLLSRLPAFLSTRSTTGCPDLTRRRSFPPCLAALSIRTTSPDSAAIVAKAAPVSATAQEVPSSPSMSSSGWAVEDLLQFSLRAPSRALIVYHKSISFHATRSANHCHCCKITFLKVVKRTRDRTKFTYMVSFQCSAIICSTADAYITIQCILKFYFAEEMHGTDDVTCCSRCGDLNIFAWRCYKVFYWEQFHYDNQNGMIDIVYRLQVYLGFRIVALGLAFGIASLLWLGFIFDGTIIQISLTLAVRYMAFFTVR
ncbi:unnamed protein product [Triticum turgidum subsp. durum]|uniref:Uncharacterized protein n=1 Tax=Triticum turgidum subsp. durum TaxID=4567 RepID=A0A9R1BNW3_TRITD|nr:unnamed protein product [Triticum turgidum subsp. durum]